MVALALALVLGCFCSNVRGGFPDGPSQQCRDDAGPPWVDDGPVAYYRGYPNSPVLPQSGECPAPLKDACASKDALAAFMDGPLDCGGAGWFCRITDQPGHRAPGFGGRRFPDSNFASCNQSNTDHDRDGHCHGSDHDDTYGWWIRDHWHRNYAGSLKCCCNWKATIGVVNRCDYRMHVDAAFLPRCRDANEQHSVDWHPGCTAQDFAQYKEPPADTCWELKYFAPAQLEEPDSPAPAPPPADCLQKLKGNRRLAGSRRVVGQTSNRNLKALRKTCYRTCREKDACDAIEVLTRGRRKTCKLVSLKYDWDEPDEIRLRRGRGWEVYYDGCKLHDDRRRLTAMDIMV
eukprot:TRINITY_DN18420_c0_g1_i2.p1 TRINITY_DN18420_c0_g1~~TRINITY_DN18420_c0_g1_i2.p1  ORF type:complete len:371 (-),score=53.71 TRINITY_DN18420_c0_g1_i2:119-1156(-)